MLDLDETLIHSHHDGVLRPTVRPGTPPDFILKVCVGWEAMGWSCLLLRSDPDFLSQSQSVWSLQPSSGTSGTLKEGSGQ